MLDYRILDRVNIRSNIIYRIRIDLDDEFSRKLKDGSVKEILNRELDRIGVELAGKGFLFGKILKLDQGTKTIVAAVVPFGSEIVIEDLHSGMPAVSDALEVAVSYPETIKQEGKSRYVKLTGEVAAKLKRQEYGKQIGYVAKAFNNEIFIDHFMYFDNNLITQTQLTSITYWTLESGKYMKILVRINDILEYYKNKILSKKADTVYIFNLKLARRLSRILNCKYLKSIQAKNKLDILRYLKELTNMIFENHSYVYFVFARNGKITNIITWELGTFGTMCKFFSGLSLVFDDKTSRVYRIGDRIDSVLGSLKHFTSTFEPDIEDVLHVFSSELKSILLIGRERSEIEDPYEQHRDLSVLSILDFR